MATKSKGKATKGTGATGPANVKSKAAPAAATDAGLGGGGGDGGGPDDKKEDAKKKLKKDPINVATGTVEDAPVDLWLHGPVPFELRRFYSSADFAKSGPLGRGGWTHAYHQRIELDGEGFVLRGHDGTDLFFGPITDGGIALHRGRHMALRRSGERFEILQLVSSWTRRYEPLSRGGPAVLRSISDPYGNRLTLHYQDALDPRSSAASPCLARVTDTAGREVHFSYDDRGRLVAVAVEVEGRMHPVFTYGYTAEGELASAADALGHAVRYAYDGKHRLVEKQLQHGFTVRYAYDPLDGRVVRTWGDGGLHSAELTYDREKRTTTLHADPEPRIFHMDAHDNIVREESFDGRDAIDREWDDDHLLLSETDAAGLTEAFEYDARGFLVKRTDRAGQVTTYEHEDDRLRRLVHPDGTFRKYEYDGFGGLWSVTIETGARYSVDRDGRGHIAALYGPTGLIERREHDARHQLVKLTTARGRAVSYTYDDLGRPLVRTDALGGKTSLRLDATGQIVAISRPDGTLVECEHDARGRVTHIRKPGGDLSIEYVGLRALSRLVTEDGGEWRITHDRNEKPVRIENPKGERHERRFDRSGRLVEERTFDGRTLRYSYDLSGRLRRIERPDQTWRELEYDPLGNVLVETSTHGTITFERDARGRMLGATLDEDAAKSEVKLERDTFGRVVAETQDGATIRYAWDVENRLVGRAMPGGQVTRFAYDLDGDVAAIEHAGQVFRIDRDLLGREVSRTLPGSAATLATTYDAMSRLASQEVTRPSARGDASREALVARKWTYDAVGRPVRVDDTRWGPTEYFYDLVHDLVRSASRIDEVFEHDPAGEIVGAVRGLASESEPWKLTRGGVVLRTEAAAYEYDAARRRTKATRLEKGEPTSDVTEMIWDCRDRLREAHLPNGDIVRYFYDALGRRTRKVIFPKGPSDPLVAPPPARVVRFLWEGDVLASESDSALGDRVLVHLPGTYRPFLQQEQGEIYTYVLDATGVARELLDSRGRVAWAGNRTAFGEIASVYREPGTEKPRPVEPPFRLMGHYADEETGLYCSRFRYFDPKTAHFLSPDPIGLHGGFKLHAFPGAPTFRTDPLGLEDLNTGGYSVYGLYDSPTATEPYYIGITGRDTSERAGEHEGTGRLSGTAEMRTLESDINYGQARGYEQAYMEFYGTRPTDEKGEFPANELNSFRHERTDDPDDERAATMSEHYQEKMEELEQTGKAKKKQTC